MAGRMKMGHREGIGVGAGILGALLVIVTLGLVFGKAPLNQMGYGSLDNAGTYLAGILMGIVVWAVVEHETKAGTGLKSLLIRFIPAFLLGFFIGALFGELMNWEQYLVVPITYGNPFAIFFGIAMIVGVLSFTADAVWSHTQNFRVRG